MAGHVISPEFNAGEHTDTAALIGTAASAIKSMAEPIYEELGLVRIQRWQGEGEAWPESSAASTSAVAGAAGGELFGGCRSYGFGRLSAMVHKRTSWWRR